MAGSEHGSPPAAAGPGDAEVPQEAQASEGAPAPAPAPASSEDAPAPDDSEDAPPSDDSEDAPDNPVLTADAPTPVADTPEDEPPLEPASDEQRARAREGWASLAVTPDDIAALSAAAEDPSGSRALASVLAELLTAAEPAALFRRAAEIFEHEIGDLARALDAWRAALAAQPAHEAAETAVRRLARATERWDLVLAEYETRAAADPDAWLAWELKIGDLLERRPDTVDDAIERYMLVLELEPGHAETIERVEALHSEREAWADLAAFYAAIVDTLPDDRRVAICRNGAVLQGEVLGDLDAAALWHERVLSDAPDDADALAAVQATYERQARWGDLESLLEARLGEPGEREGRLRALAALREEHLGSPVRAAATWVQLLTDAPGDDAALTALERIYAAQAEWHLVINVLQRRLDATEDAAGRAQLRCRQARLLRGALQDVDEAIRHFELALDEVAGHAPAVDALTTIHGERGDTDAAIALMERRVSWSDDPAARAALNINIARLWRDHVSRVDRAVEHFERALVDDPDNLRALAPLADHYIGVEQWARAMPLLEVLAHHVDEGGDGLGRARVHQRIAECAEALLDDVRALDEYAAAEQLGADDPAIRRALARLAFRLERHAEAEQWHQRLLARDNANIADDERAELRARMGQSALALDAPERAVTHLSAALEARPADPALIRPLIAALVATEAWPEVASRKRSLINITDDDLERYALWIELGDVRRAHLGDGDGAAGAYQQALMVRPGARAPVVQLVELYAAGDAPRETIRWLRELAALEQDRAKRAKIELSIAMLLRDQVGAPAEAVEAFEAVLDLDPSVLDAFRAVDTILTDAGDGEALEAAYKRMIRRIQGADDAVPRRDHLLFLLFRSLGRLYQSILDRPGYAVQALEVAANIQPADLEVHETLAHLYARSRDTLGKAAEHYQTLIRGASDRFDLYHRLLTVHRHLGQPDRVWSIAGLLVGFGEAGEAEAAFYRQQTPNAMRLPSRPLEDDEWLSSLQSPGEDPVIGQVLESLYEGMVQDLPIQSARQLGLKRGDLVDPDSETLVNAAVQTACYALRLPLPDLYIVDGAEPFRILPLMTPALGVARGVMSGSSQRDLAMHAATRLVYLHPRRWMATLYQESQLELIFLAALRLFQPEADLRLRASLPAAEREAVEQQVENTRKLLKRDLSKTRREHLAGVFRRRWSDEVRPNLAAWHRHCELTALQAAVYACGDVAMVIDAIRHDRLASTSTLSRGDKLRAVTHWALGDQLTTLRQATGLALRQPSAAG